MSNCESGKSCHLCDYSLVKRFANTVLFATSCEGDKITRKQYISLRSKNVLFLMFRCENMQEKGILKGQCICDNMPFVLPKANKITGVLSKGKVF